MATSAAKKQVTKHIDDGFRLKFIDEQNYSTAALNAIKDEDKSEREPPRKSTIRGREGKPLGRGEGVTLRNLDLDPNSDRRASKKRDGAEQVVAIEQAELEGKTAGAARLRPARPKIDLGAMKAGALAARANRKALRAEAIARNAKSLRQPIDWSRMDQTGRPVVSFDPFSKERKALLKVLQRKFQDRTRQQVVRKLGVEFSRIYERYRKEAERRKTGLSDGFFASVIEREMKSCEEAAIMCVLRGVTPRQVLEYWDNNIRHFTNSRITIPSLGFLKSPSAIDRVACSAIGTTGRLERLKKTPETTRLTPEARNTFSATDGLDIRLRSTLENGGFRTQSFNDRYLLGIQHNALAIAAGKSIFLAEGRVRDMSKYAAKQLYSGAANDANS